MSQLKDWLKSQNEVLEVAKCSYSETEETATPATAKRAMAVIVISGVPALFGAVCGTWGELLTATGIRFFRRSPVNAARPQPEIHRRTATRESF